MRNLMTIASVLMTIMTIVVMASAADGDVLWGQERPMAVFSLCGNDNHGALYAGGAPSVRVGRLMLTYFSATCSKVAVSSCQKGSTVAMRQRSVVV